MLCRRMCAQGSDSCCIVNFPEKKRTMCVVLVFAADKTEQSCNPKTGNQADITSLRIPGTRTQSFAATSLHCMHKYWAQIIVRTKKEEFYGSWEHELAFWPLQTITDTVNLKKYHIYIRDTEKILKT